MNKKINFSLFSLLAAIIFLANSLSLKADSCDNCATAYRSCMSSCACQQECWECRENCFIPCFKGCKRDVSCRERCLSSCVRQCEGKCHCSQECPDKCSKDFYDCTWQHCWEWALRNASVYEMNFFRHDGSKIGTRSGVSPDRLVVAETDFPITAAYAPDCPTLSAPNCQNNDHYRYVIEVPDCYTLWYGNGFYTDRMVCWEKNPN